MLVPTWVIFLEKKVPTVFCSAFNQMPCLPQGTTQPLLSKLSAHRLGCAQKQGAKQPASLCMNNNNNKEKKKSC